MRRSRRAIPVSPETAAPSVLANFGGIAGVFFTMIGILFRIEIGELLQATRGGSLGGPSED